MGAWPRWRRAFPPSILAAHPAGALRIGRTASGRSYESSQRLCLHFGRAATDNVLQIGGRLTLSPALARVALLAAWLVFTLYAVWGLPTVPFHPDESTYLYMSRDFDLLFREGQPSAVSWQAEGQPAAVRRYRLLDAPLVRYLSGLSRTLFGQPPLAQDWAWSASWDANVAAGALPNSRALNAARLPATLFAALSLLPVYGLAAQLGGRWAGAGAAMLYALSGLLLLHGRRAMSEGPMLFFALLTAWLALRRYLNWRIPAAIFATVAASGAILAPTAV